MRDVGKAYTCAISCWRRSGGVRGFIPLTMTGQLKSVYRWPETLTSPVLNDVFVPQMRVFEVELACKSVMSQW